MALDSRVNRDRVERLASVIAGIGLERILLLEESDPQLHAVSRVAGAHGRGVASVSSVLVALVSYRLRGSGEEWWTCYGRYFSEGQVEASVEGVARAVLGFLDYCRLGWVQREAKKRRVRRAAIGARSALERLLREPETVLEGVSWLLEALAGALGAKPWRKTIAFAGKMAYYSARAGSRVPAPWDSLVPVDLRIACLTLTSRLVRASTREEVMRNPQPAVRAWGEVSRLAGVPPYNLDSLLWLAGSPARYEGVEEARRAIAARLEPVLGEHAWRLTRELVLAPCRTR